MSGAGAAPSDDAHVRVKIERMADALTGLVLAFENNEAVFIKSLDYILTALEGPFSLLVTDRDGVLPPFETGPSGIAASAPISYFGRLELVVRVCERMSDDRLAAELSRVQALAPRFSTCLPPELEEEIGDIMREAMAELGKGASDPKAPVQRTPTEPDDDLVDLMAGLDRALKGTARHMFFDAIQGELEQTPQADAKLERKKLKAPRVFFLRSAPSAPNGRHLHMLASQVAYFDQYWRNLHGGETAPGSGASLLREALDRQGAWPTLDAVMQRGVAAWIELPDLSRGEHSDLASAAATRMFDAMALGKERADGAASPALCIPIHVAGLPWLTMMLMFPDMAPEKRGAAAWFFYRDVGSYLNNSIRKIALRTYEDRLWRRLLEFFETETLEPRRLNERLEALTFSLPYPAWKFQIGSGATEHDVLDLDGGKTLRAISTVTRSAEDGLRIDLYGYTREELKDRVVSAKAFQDAKRLEIAMRRVLSYRDFGHTLKNLLEFTNWDSTRTDIGKLRRSPDLPAKASNVLRRAYASLGLFSTVQGLGHLMNVAGRVDSSDPDWTKYASWLDDARSVDFIDGDAEAYAAAAFSIAVALSERRDISTVHVTCAEPDASVAIRSWSREDAQHPAFVVKQLHFAPFRAGSDAPFLLIIALVEPLVNAIRALEVAARATGQRHPLELDVSRKGDCMRISVSNVGATVKLPTLSGMRSVRRMLAETQMFELSDPEEAEISDGRSRFTVKLDIRPRYLVDLINGAQQRPN
jgi:hypothetical protein